MVNEPDPSTQRQLTNTTTELLHIYFTRTSSPDSSILNYLDNPLYIPPPLPTFPELTTPNSPSYSPVSLSDLIELPTFEYYDPDSPNYLEHLNLPSPEPELISEIELLFTSLPSTSHQLVTSPVSSIITDQVSSPSNVPIPSLPSSPTLTASSCASENPIDYQLPSPISTQSKDLDDQSLSQCSTLVDLSLPHLSFPISSPINLPLSRLPFPISEPIDLSLPRSPSSPPSSPLDLSATRFDLFYPCRTPSPFLDQ